MAGLSAALNFARSSLSTVAGQTAVTSRNVANAGNADYSRKTANVVALSSGSLAIDGYNRSADKLLLEKMLAATSNAAASASILSGITSIAETIGDPEQTSSPAGAIGAFQKAMQTYQQNPSDTALARGAVQAASSVVRTLNNATETVQAARQEADSGMSQSVSRINTLLQQFKVVNDAIVRGSGSATDLTENLDTRDKTMKLLSEEIGIRAVSRANNDIALYTDSGVTLFETNPRSVTLQPTTNMAPGVGGNAVYIDGVDVTTPSGPMATRSGNLYGLAKVRDDIGVTAQAQLDEIARGLVATFAESDQSATPSLPQAAGLFTWSGAPAVPASGVTVAGLAADLRLNAAVDPAQGGNVSKLRDGGINGAAYLYNQTGGAGYSARITQLLEGLDGTQSFDATTTLDPQTSVKTFAAASAGWVEALRQQATTSSDLQATVKSRSSDALGRVTGVSIDEEMTVMLELERSYQASAKLISTVDTMLQNLLAAVK
jgi:flagellar hook-associated protein 1 FlgK